jgi:hypothetical protein
MDGWIFASKRVYRIGSDLSVDSFYFQDCSLVKIPSPKPEIHNEELDLICQNTPDAYLTAVCLIVSKNQLGQGEQFFHH